MNNASGTIAGKYRSKLISAEKAAQLVKDGSQISYGSFHTKPIAFDEALAKRISNGDFKKMDIYITGTIAPIPQALLKMVEQKEHGDFGYQTTWYGPVERALSPTGVVSYVPLQFQDGDRIRGGANWHHCLSRDVSVIQTAAMDQYGNFNYGITNAYTRPDLLNSPLKIVEVNTNYPVVYGGSEESVNIDEIDYIIEGSNPEIFCIPHIEPTDQELKIAEHIIPMIKDGACLQLGIGGIPNIIGKMIAQSDLKNLGVHSEMFCDAYYDMYQSGKITNTKKRIDKGKSVFTFCLCTKETMEFMGNNPLLASYNSEYVTHHENIAAIDNVVAINGTMEMDIMGQASSEAIGYTQYSGTGGQLSFTIGAYESKGGVAILCLPSTFQDKQGNLTSKIKATLSPGSVVTIPRTIVSTIVTEYGAVNIKGLNLWNRTEALINLAHPDFRDELVAEAQKMNIWRKSNKIV